MRSQYTPGAREQKMRRSPPFPSCIRSGVPHLFLTALLLYATVGLPNPQGEPLLCYGKLATSYYKENIDTTTSMGRLIFHINSAYAEFERDIIRDRVKAGIRAKREKTGRWGRGVLPSDVQTQIQELIRAGTSIRKIAKQLQISTRTVRKYK